MIQSYVPVIIALMAQSWHLKFPSYTSGEVGIYCLSGDLERIFELHEGNKNSKLRSSGLSAVIPDKDVII